MPRWRAAACGRYPEPMPKVTVAPPAAPSPLDAATLEPLPDRVAAGWRLRGRDSAGRLLQLDGFGEVPVTIAVPPGAASRVFVHEDVGARVEATVPPRRVPWSKRLFWQLVLLLLRARPTRDWLLRRYAP